MPLKSDLINEKRDHTCEHEIHRYNGSIANPITFIMRKKIYILIFFNFACYVTAKYALFWMKELDSLYHNLKENMPM